MKQRIIGIIVVIALTVSSVFAQPVYANVGLVSDEVDMLYALLESAGIVIAEGGSASDKYDATYSIFTQMALEQSDYIQSLYDNAVAVDGGYLIKNTPDFTFDVDYFLNLYNSALAVLQSNFYYSVPDNYTETVLTTTPVVNDMYALGDPFFVVCRSTGLRTVTGFSSTGYFLHYFVDSDGVVTLLDYHGVVCDPETSYLHLSCGINSKGWLNYSVTPYLNGTSYLYNTSGNAGTVGSNGLAWGQLGICNGYGGAVDLDGLDFGDNLGYIDDGVNCDSWATDLSDAIADGNKDVIINTGLDLSDYDTVADARTGLIDNVDFGDDVATDLTPDLQGVTDGLESANNILDMIYSKIRVLPTTLIGTGSLDLSGFSDIDLSGVFPFCIPFDLIRSFQGFNVTPIEPKWTFDFSNTPLQAGGVVDVDLTQFDDLFAIVRYFVYGFFVIGLIMATRKLIKG